MIYAVNLKPGAEIKLNESLMLVNFILTITINFIKYRLKQTTPSSVQ